jgi:hypothetical protein
MKSFFYRQALAVVILGVAIILLVSATPVKAFSITATENIQDWVFTPGLNQNPAPLVLTVTTESYPWTVHVRDPLTGEKKSGSAGKLLEYNTGTGWVNSGSEIAENMTVIGETSTGVAGSTVPLGPTNRLIETGSAAVSGKQMAITLQQPISYTDPILTNGNNYRVILTFTLTQP